MPDGDAQYREALARYTNPHLRTYTPVPPPRAGICDVCHNAPGERDDGVAWPRCASCHRNCARVHSPVLEVIPISLYVMLHQLHTVLRGYKDDSSQSRRRTWTIQVAAIFGRFITNHGACIAATVGQWDTITTVPSTRFPDQQRRPLDNAIDLLAGRHSDRRALLGPGADPIGRTAAEHGFEPTVDANGRRVLLVDDTYVSGARIQSAATALTRGGATVLTALVIGRVINPNFNTQAADLWTRAAKRHFTFDTCCLCAQPW